MRSPHTGHNGKVIIDGQGTEYWGVRIWWHNTTIDGLDSSKFLIKNFYDQNIRMTGGITGTTIKNLTVSMNDAVSPTTFCMIFGYNVNNTLIENVVVFQDSGSYTGLGNADGIQFGGSNGITIRNCYVKIQNANNSPHSDAIQMYNCNDITVENSIIKHLNAGSTANKQGLYADENCGGVIKIRNNYLEYGQPGGQDLMTIGAMWTDYTAIDSIIITNNTIKYTNGAGDGIGFANNLGANFKGRGICKNNIVVAVNVRLDTTFFGYAHRSNVTNNVYYNPAGGVSIYKSVMVIWGGWKLGDKAGKLDSSRL
jgi:hypothetical protein